METNFLNIYPRFPGFKTRAVTLSFDDGFYYDRDMVKILDQYGVKCTFNLNSFRLDQKNCIASEEVAELYKNHEVAVHTLTHPHLQDLDRGSLAYQIIADRKYLEELVQKPVEGMAYPYCLKDVPGLVDTVAACGIRYSRTVDNTHSLDLPDDYLRWHPTCHQSDPRLPEMFDKLLAPVPPVHQRHVPVKLLYIWGHSYEYKDNWEALENMCKLISGNEEVWYATNGEIVDYMEAYRRLRRTLDNRCIYNPTDKRIYVWTKTDNVILEPGSITRL